MNEFDLVLAALTGAAAWAGWRMGLVRGVFAWAGFAVGLVIGVMFVDDIANEFPSASPQARFAIALAALLLLVGIAQTLGIAIGSTVATLMPNAGPIRTLDHVGGGAMGAVVALAILWLLIPALASTPGWTSRAVRGSWIAQEVQAAAPEPPSSLEALGRLVSEAPFPSVFRELTNQYAGDPPTAGLDPAVAARVAAGVVRVEGQACGLVVEGSGFAVAPDVVVTNAHVVAGQRAPDVFGNDGKRRDATVVAFDPARDLAVLRVDVGGLPPLPISDATTGTEGAVFGHPGGGPLVASPARVERVVDARGSDIYRTSPTARAVLVLASRLEPGDSGGPLVDRDGRVVGVAFAVDPGDATTAYALARSELDAILANGGGATAAIDTGRCLVG